jgi:general secretion pathway protein K
MSRPSHSTARASRPRPREQRGAALLTAMIIVTLVATLASAMVWQQWRAIQVEAAERARAQSAWILSGALDFAQLILRETVKPNRPTALTDPWATPLAEARLSTFLAVDKSSTSDGPEAFLSGSISDAQGRYNLRNLVALKDKNGKPSEPNVDPAELEALKHLCEFVGVESGVADRIASGLLSATLSAGGATPLEPETVAQLTWLGIAPDAVRALRPYVVLLPLRTKLNVNTASREVLAAVMNKDVASAERLVQIAQRTPFVNVPDFRNRSGLTSEPTTVDTRSSFFEVRTRVRLNDRVLVEQSLVRLVNGQASVLHRERVASVEQAGS